MSQQTFYPFRAVEEKWQNYWKTHDTFATTHDASKPFTYVLSMFPYPSGKLHMGHVRNYTIADVIARFKRKMQHNVLHPIGWDAFGLPAENAALLHNTHPQVWTKQNAQAMRTQLKGLGISYDWSREIFSCDPDYYAHEQSIFLDFLKKGLVFRKESYVNWDPIDQTILANEQVIDGKGWRSGAVIEQRLMPQWFLKITHYADELLSGLDALPHWPEAVKTMQRKWIDRSVGAHISFPLHHRTYSLVKGVMTPNADPHHNDDDNEAWHHALSSVSSLHEDNTALVARYTSSKHSKTWCLNVYSTRPETLFGASFCAIAPDHPLCMWQKNHNADLDAFIHQWQRQRNTEYTEEQLYGGCFTGMFVEHPLDPQKLLPIYAAHYVLKEYGTGAIFGCPAHDSRDFAFAARHNLPMISVMHDQNGNECAMPYEESQGTIVRSDFLSGLSIAQGRERITQYITEHGLGKAHTQYRLKDWGVSRQRYWGCPIPIIYCAHCGIMPVPKEALPVQLPYDVVFTGKGNPLEHHPTWKHTSCPQCQKPAIRETDTFDTFMESSWYFARFCSPHNQNNAFDASETEKWLPVAHYIGGIEHAILHLLYARFFTKALRDCGYWSISEPFQGLFTQGMVTHKTFQDQNGHWCEPQEAIYNASLKRYEHFSSREPLVVGNAEKMSKSKKNVVSVEDMLEHSGADVIRFFVLSDTPPEKDFEWTHESLQGAWRFVNRLWRALNHIEHCMTSLVIKECQHNASHTIAYGAEFLSAETHKRLNKMTCDLERFKLNTFVSHLREYLSHLDSLVENFNSLADAPSLMSEVWAFLNVAEIVLPHICAEFTSRFCGATHFQLLHKKPFDSGTWTSKWPAYEQIAENTVCVVVQLNGKKRETIDMPINSSEESVLQELATRHPTLYAHYCNHKRVKYVPNRVLNIIAPSS